MTERELVALMAAVVYPHVSSKGAETDEQVAIRIARGLLSEVDAAIPLAAGQ